jgi:hypothetical protein
MDSSTPGPQNGHSSLAAISPLHRSLRLSIPGAMLLSIPVGLFLREHASFYFGAQFGSLLGRPSPILVLAAFAPLAVATLVTSFRAILVCSETDDRPFLCVLVILFNCSALLIACLGCLGLFIAIATESV